MIDLSSKSGNIRLTAGLFVTIVLMFSALLTSCSDESSNLPWGDIEMPDDPEEVEKLLVGTWSQAGYNTLVLNRDGSLEYIAKVTYTDDKGENTTKVETWKGNWSFVRDYLNVEVYGHNGKLHKYTPQFRVSERKLYMTYERSDEDAWVEYSRVVTPDDDSESAQKKLLIGDWADGNNTLSLKDNGDFEYRIFLTSQGSESQGGNVGTIYSEEVIHGTYSFENGLICFMTADNLSDKYENLNRISYKNYTVTETQLKLTPLDNSNSDIFDGVYDKIDTEKLLIGDWADGNNTLSLKDNGDFKARIISLDQGGGIGAVYNGAYNVEGEYITFASFVEKTYRFKVTASKLYLTDEITSTTNLSDKSVYTHEFDRVD